MFKEQILEPIVLLLLVALVIPVTANAQTQTLVLWHANGTTTDVDLNTVPKVLFTDSTLLIKSTVLDMEYAAEEITKFTFKSKDTSIDTSKDDNRFQLQNGNIVFHQIRNSDGVALYRPDGIRIPVRPIVNGDDAVLPLSSLPHGTYIIRVNGRSSKIMLK